MKKTIQILGGIVALVLLLAGAAYMGGRLLNGEELPGIPNMFVGNGGREARMNVDDVQRAKELPTTPAAANGVFDHRQDKSIFVGTGIVSVGVQTDEHGNVVDTESEYNGPLVEVVVTSQTTVYADVTMRQYNGSLPEGQQIQQVVQPGSLDDIDEQTTITVWGRKTGDRIIADVLVYKPVDFEK